MKLNYSEEFNIIYNADISVFVAHQDEDKDALVKAIGWSNLLWEWRYDDMESALKELMEGYFSNYLTIELMNKFQFVGNLNSSVDMVVFNKKREYCEFNFNIEITEVIDTAKYKHYSGPYAKIIFEENDVHIFEKNLIKSMLRYN